MNAKVMNYSDTVAEELATIIDIENQEEIVENQEVKVLTCPKRKRLISTYITIIVKRMIDICAGIVGTIVLVPLTLIIYIANKICGDGGPVFYTQDRIGKDGKIFKMLKYRSMVVGADEILEKYLEENEEARKEYKLYKKLKYDPRVTKIGSFLRKTSLDEMPQLIHLLTGEMSLIGPRPYLPREREDMGTYYDVIIKSKPGITGMWQVSGRSNATFEERLDLDVRYDKNNSLKTDVSILYKTAMRVMKKEGAI